MYSQLCQKLQQRNKELRREVADLEAEQDACYCRLLNSLHDTDLIDNNKTVPI
jgi:cell division protein FtsB